MPGMIGLACGDLARYSDFVTSMIGLHRPPGTFFMKGSGLGPAVSFNIIAREVIKQDLDWLFLTNDDNLCPADTIPRLLAWDKDVVTGFYVGRHYPFQPILFDFHEEVNGKPWYHRRYPQKGENGLVPIVGCGDGCLLIRTHVLKAIADPWWEYGEALTDQCDHDIVFSRKVLGAGFSMWCDLSLRVDHVGPIAIRPVQDADGTWAIDLVQSEDNHIRLPFPEDAYVRRS